MPKNFVEVSKKIKLQKLQQEMSFLMSKNIELHKFSFHLKT